MLVLSYQPVREQADIVVDLNTIVVSCSVVICITQMRSPLLTLVPHVGCDTRTVMGTEFPELRSTGIGTTMSGSITP
jgi:hypothetical protein